MSFLNECKVKYRKTDETGGQEDYNGTILGRRVILHGS
jgi:hypothetical protein